jgi:hypothetical protein
LLLPLLLLLLSLLLVHAYFTASFAVFKQHASPEPACIGATSVQTVVRVLLCLPRTIPPSTVPRIHAHKNFAEIL